MRRHSQLRNLPYTLLGLLFLAVMLFPVYWMVNTSLQAGPAAVNATFLPLHPTLSAYREAISGQLGNIRTSLLIAGGAVLVTVVIATPAAFALAKFRLRWTAAVMLVLLISQMVPSIAIANALYPVYNDLGLVNTVPGLVLADSSISIPFAILILRASMGSIPNDLLEAARLDGAGHFRAFRSVIVPLSRNSIITAGLFSFLFAWSDFVFALTLTTGTTVRPVTLGIYSYLGSQIQSWGPLMATAVLPGGPPGVLDVVGEGDLAVLGVDPRAVLDGPGGGVGGPGWPAPWRRRCRPSVWPP